MGSNPNEDYSKSSSDEEETDNTVTAWRSYECMFCKRGFTTAQALGGHMNIHRKFRANNMPQSSSSSISDKFVVANNNYYDNNYASFRSFAPVIPSYPTTHNHHDQYFGLASEVHANYQTYFPSSTNSSNHINNYDSYGQNHQQLNVFGDENGQRNLGLSVGESHHVATAYHEKEKRSLGVSEEDELDLELRLGHHRVLF